MPDRNIGRQFANRRSEPIDLLLQCLQHSDDPNLREGPATVFVVNPAKDFISSGLGHANKRYLVRKNGSFSLQH
jgi:hypothetical protein